jgi:uncharacterized membrane protein
MAQSWQSVLERWSKASLLDAATTERIRAFEASREGPKQLRWPVLIAIGFGALMVGAGVLLFVSAHWDELSPAGRFSIVLLLVVAFHVVGAVLSERFPAFATALHGVGTAALGAGIFLAAQIFNLEEHWPGGVMLWALGAWIAWWLRRDWVQAAYVELLTPAWLASEWIDATERFPKAGAVLAQGVLLLCITYLTALYLERRGNARRALAWIGGVALIPMAIAAMEMRLWQNSGPDLPRHLLLLGNGLALALPLLLALWLRGRAAWMNGAAAVWVLGLNLIPSRSSILPYVWYAVSSLALIAWGLKEARRERINLGVVGFGLTVLGFYFSNVMDKLGRSASLIGLGLLFLGLAWVLERTRRQLVAKVKGAAA